MNYHVYWNLHLNCVSYFTSGKRVRHARSVHLNNVEFFVREGHQPDPPQGTRLWTLENRQKCVHAFAIGQLVQAFRKSSILPLTEERAAECGWVRVSYNPYKFSYFYRKDNNLRVSKASRVIVNKHGIFALHPQ